MKTDRSGGMADFCVVCDQQLAPQRELLGYCGKACYNEHMRRQAVEIQQGKRICLHPYIPLQVTRLRFDT